MKNTASFLDTDDPKFVDIVSMNLEKGAPVLHQMSPEQYVSKCRELWTECELDEVFTFKVIIDKPLLKQNPPRGVPWEGMEEISAADSIEEDLYCIAIGLIT